MRVRRVVCASGRTSTPGAVVVGVPAAHGGRRARDGEPPRARCRVQHCAVGRFHRRGVNVGPPRRAVAILPATPAKPTATATAPGPCCAARTATIDPGGASGWTVHAICLGTRLKQAARAPQVAGCSRVSPFAARGCEPARFAESAESRGRPPAVDDGTLHIRAGCGRGILVGNSRGRRAAWYECVSTRA